MALTIFDPFGVIEIPEGSTGLDTERRRNQFYQLIGKCIKEWANVEEKLFDLFVFVLDAPRKQAAIVYYKSPTIDTRLNLTDELVRAKLPERIRKNGGKDHPHLVVWTKLNTAIKDLLPPRNQLAHAPVREVEKIERRASLASGDVFATLATWLEIVESKGERLRGRGEKKPIRTKDLTTHLKEVEDLSVRISVFHGLIAAKPPEEPAPHKSPQT